MARRRGDLSPPLSARLFALVVVPLLAVGFLATARIDAERASASEASDLVKVVELQQEVAAIFSPAQVERLALSGLAAVDALGVPREVIVGVTGFDLESLRSENLVDLERAFDDLNDSYRTLELPDGTMLGDRLGPIRGSLQSQQLLSDETRATVNDVERVFEQLDTLLAEILSIDSYFGDSSTVVGRNRTQLSALADVLVSAGVQAQFVIDGTIGGDGDQVETARLAAVHDTYVAVYREKLDPAEQTLFDRTSVDGNPTDVGTIREDDTAGAVAADPNLVRGAADIVVGQIDYLAALDDYSNGFHERAASEVRSASNHAEGVAQRTQMLLWAIAAFTLALILLVLWSILGPIRHLTRRAAEINAGEVDLPPLDVNGPRDVRALTATMNGLVSTLDRVNQRIQLLASGVDQEEPDTVLPGVLGDSLRHSFLHLANVTGQLHRSEALSSAIVAQADDAIWTTDDDGTVLTANDASSRLTGVATSEQCGRSINEMLSRTDGEALVTTRSDVQPKVLVARTVIDAGADRVTAVVAHDISERIEFEDRLSYQALHDALTGLPNRFAVLEYLDEMRKEHPGQVAVLYLDLDGFKSVNDVRGHAAGDRVLADVATRLMSAVRNGEFIGRLGGDEFVVVTHRFAQMADVIALGHRLIREVELPLDDDGSFFSLSAGVGVAIPKAGTTALEMIGQADNAVYQAKRRGRGCVGVFDIAMQKQIDREAELELALRTAVSDGELVLHLQPMTDLRTNRVTAAEALVRWNRPGHGLVPPDDFIPIAERSGIIFEIERWVLMQACERIAAWKERDPSCPRRIAVNISGRHLSDGDLLADIDAALGVTGADPTMLELELTETKLLEDMDRAETVLNELRARGMTIAIDDFGTGYSSMTYLRELPVDCIKIDRSFVSGATDDGYDSTVIEALLTIGRTLELTVVAEGVETEEQLEYVRSRGCHFAQGFLLARPMPIADAEAYIFAESGIG